MRLIKFHVDDYVYDNLQRLATRQGFKTLTGYIRNLLETMDTHYDPTKAAVEHQDIIEKLQAELTNLTAISKPISDLTAVIEHFSAHLATQRVAMRGVQSLNADLAQAIGWSQKAVLCSIDKIMEQQFFGTAIEQRQFDTLPLREQSQLLQAFDARTAEARRLMSRAGPLLTSLMVAHPSDSTNE
jgi:uncharacterized phage infection (PIP) family protein YhgE